MAFSALPSELIVRILSFLQENYLDVIHVGNSAREPYSCSLEPSVWRSLTLHRWKYSKKHLTSLTIDWRAEFIRRFRLDQHIDDTVEKLIYQPDPPNYARIPRFREVKDWGLDAKDAILRHINCHDTVDDVLARRYWARALLTAFYRRQAVEEWQKLAAGEHVPLERVIATFDMFIRDGEEGDFGSVSQWLDDLAEEFQQLTPSYKTLSNRSLALELAQYLVTRKGFTGSSEETYYTLTNNFIGLTLQDPAREGMPLIYVAIFCAIAGRLGLDAQPCGFPSHVFAIVDAPEGFDLDGKARATNQHRDRMYLDLYSVTSLEISQNNLHSLLNDLGFPDSQHEQHLAPATMPQVAMRMRQNLMHCLSLATQARDGATPASRFLGLYLNELMYLVLWMTMVFYGDDVGAFHRQLSHLDHTLTSLESSFTGDWYLLNEVIVPMFQGRPGTAARLDMSNAIRQRDLVRHPPKYRTHEVRQQVLYKVGTCFRHKNYGYVGVIIGWDTQCRADSEWQGDHRVEALSQGANQCFYNVVSADRTMRYVAQENIGPMPPSGPADEILRLAGKYFLRWDASLMRFVSNLKCEYPDD